MVKTRTICTMGNHTSFLCRCKWVSIRTTGQLVSFARILTPSIWPTCENSYQTSFTERHGMQTSFLFHNPFLGIAFWQDWTSESIKFDMMWRTIFGTPVIQVCFLHFVLHVLFQLMCGELQAARLRTIVRCLSEGTPPSKTSTGLMP